MIYFRNMRTVKEMKKFYESDYLNHKKSNH